MALPYTIDLEGSGSSFVHEGLDYGIGNWTAPIPGARTSSGSDRTLEVSASGSGNATSGLRLEVHQFTEDLNDELETARLTVRSVDGASVFWRGVIRDADPTEPYLLTTDAAIITALLASGLTTVRLLFEWDAVVVGQAEGIGVGDSVTRARLFKSAVASDEIGVADSVRARLDQAAGASEGIGVADSVRARLDQAAGAAEGIGVADSVRATRLISADASEGIGVADSVTATLRAASPEERAEAAKKLYMRSLRALKPAAFVAAIEVSHPMAATPLRVVMDGRDREINGQTFSRANISAKLQDEKANQAPRAELSIVYVGGDLRRFMNAHNGGKGATVKYMEVAPDGTVAYERDFEVLRGSLTDTGATWEVGSYFNLDRPLVQAHYTDKTAPALFRL